MKVATFFSDDQKIELHNSVLGVEKVTVGNDIVSSKYSTFGTTHEFNIENNGKTESFSIRFRMGIPAAIDIHKNGKPFFESPRHGKWRIFFGGILLIIGYELVRNFL